MDPRTGKILWEVLIELEDSRRVLEMCKPHEFKVLIGDELLDVGRVASEIQIDEPTNVMYAMQVAADDAGLLLTKLNAISGISASAVPSWTYQDVDIHITNEVATKEHAVEELLKMLETTKDKTIGAGDGDNDIHLFKSVGLKAAMGNATDTLKDMADVIVGSVEEDGLAELIEQYT